MRLVKGQHYLIVLALALIGVILGAIFDKSISEALYANGSLVNVGLIISNYALLPFFIVIGLAASSSIYILFKEKEKYHKVGRIILIIFFILALGFAKYQEYDKLKDLGSVYGDTLGKVLAIVVLLLSLCLSILLAVKLYKKHDHTKIVNYSVIYAIIVLVSLLFAVAMKYLWSRPRPWYVFGDGITPSHLADYRAIWEPRPFDAFSSSLAREYFKSFPSNHVNSSMMFLPALLLYTKMNEKLDSSLARTLIFITAILLGVLVGLNRMLCGAHFLSDVSFGLLFSVSVTYFGFLGVDKVLKSYTR